MRNVFGWFLNTKLEKILVEINFWQQNDTGHIGSFQKHMLLSISQLSRNKEKVFNFNLDYPRDSSFQFRIACLNCAYELQEIHLIQKAIVILPIHQNMNNERWKSIFEDGQNTVFCRAKYYSIIKQLLVNH